MMGMHGTGHANHAIQEADLLIALGMRFDDRVTGNLKTYAPHAKKIHIDIDASEFNKCVKVDVALHGDLRPALQALLPLLERTQQPQWWSQLREWIGESRQRELLNGDDHIFRGAHALHELWKATGGEAVVVTDVGQHQMLEAQYYPHERPRSLITSGGLGTMGFGLPAGIGAAMGLKSDKVWVVAGDGGFQMTLCELATAVQEKVPLKVAVVNNGYLGMVRQWQEMFYDKRYHATPMLSPNFVQLAAAYGIPARRVERRQDVEAAVRWAETITDGPVLLDLFVEQHDIVYPMVAPGADLHNMVRRPLSAV
jgi:acetolactate synthase-1/2/3 large subunit